MFRIGTHFASAQKQEAMMAQLLDLRAVRVVSVIVAVAITAALAAPIFVMAARVVA